MPCEFVFHLPGDQIKSKNVSRNASVCKILEKESVLAKYSFDPVPVPCSWSLGLGILSNSRKYPETPVPVQPSYTQNAKFPKKM